MLVILEKIYKNFHKRPLKHRIDKKYYITKTVTNVMSSAVKIYNNKKTNNLISEINKESSGYIGDVSSNSRTRKMKKK